MANYPIKVLVDEQGQEFIPISSTDALLDPTGQSLDAILASKLETDSIIAGSGVTLNKDTTNHTVEINCSLPGATVIDNLTTTTAGQGSLDAHQGYVLNTTKINISDIVNNVTSTDTNKPLSAYQGYLLSNRIPSKVSDLTNDAGYTSNTGTITQIKLNGNNVATSGVANIQAIPTTFASSGVASTAGTIVPLVKYGNVGYNGSLVGTNILNLSVNKFYHCYDRGATITCNYYNDAKRFFDGAYSGYDTNINPSTQFTETPFVLEVTHPTSFEMTDVSRLLIMGHRLYGTLMATKYKIEVAYNYSNGVYSWDTALDYDGTAVDICQKFYGLYCSDQGSTSAPWHRIHGVRLTISGSTSTVFQIADIQLICGRGTEQPYEAIHALPDHGGTIYGNLTVTGSINGYPKTTDLLNLIYPIGSIYMSVQDVSPATFLGGTWVALEDRFLIGASATYSAGSTGGSTTHTLTEQEMPSHSHTIQNRLVVWDEPNLTALNTATYSGPMKLREANQGLTNTTGGGQAHSIMNPYLAVYMWKRTA